MDRCNFEKCHITKLDGVTSYHMLYINTRSLPSHHQDLEALITLLRFPDLVILSETWLALDNSDPYIPRCTHFSTFRRELRGGGASAFIRDYIYARNYFTCCSDMHANVESIFVGIQRPNFPRLTGTRTAIVGGIYEAPSPPPLHPPPYYLRNYL